MSVIICTALSSHHLNRYWLYRVTVLSYYYRLPLCVGSSVLLIWLTQLGTMHMVE